MSNLNRTNVKIVAAKRAGWYAVMARIGPDTPWAQVEAAPGEFKANSIADSLEADPDLRLSEIADAKNVSWGRESPAEDFKG